MKLAAEAAAIVDKAERLGESTVAQATTVVTAPFKSIQAIADDAAGTASATAIAVEAAFATVYSSIFGSSK